MLMLLINHNGLFLDLKIPLQGLGNGNTACLWTLEWF